MTMAAADYDQVPYTIATWVFTLHVAGVHAADEQVSRHCQQVLEATEEQVGNAAGEALVARIRELLEGEDLDAVASLATALYGERVHRDLGSGDRSDRTARIRKYQFSSQLPWLARIWERQGGEVRPSWLLVERVTDEVTAADPNPWNDLEEERKLPVSDFHVLWELDGCSSLHLAR
ncbi:MAG TPA: hypothetical protein ENK18_21645 [Deltaproteobacteria bacterium]|nr:hypothetical protein [Deltaproteobacteria bacterium]